MAPRTMTVNGDISPCECTEIVTCPYCVQANLLLMEKKFKAEDDAVKAFIKHAKRNGIRRTAREIGEHEKTLRRWINSGNIPPEIVQKITGVQNG